MISGFSLGTLNQPAKNLFESECIFDITSTPYGNLTALAVLKQHGQMEQLRERGLYRHMHGDGPQTLHPRISSVPWDYMGYIE